MFIINWRRHWSLRSGVTCWCLAAILLCGSPATADDLSDPQRLAMAHGRAVLRWQLLFEKMPTHFDEHSWKEPSDEDYEDPSSLIDLIAYELWAFNSDQEAIFNYLNEALIPFVKAHRKQYLCYLTEFYAASGIPTAELGKMNDHGFFLFGEYAYLFGSTASALEARGLLVSPDHQEYVKVDVRSYLRANGWNSIVPKLEPRLGCDKL